MVYQREVGAFWGNQSARDSTGRAEAADEEVLMHQEVPVVAWNVKTEVGLTTIDENSKGGLSPDYKLPR